MLLIANEVWKRILVLRSAKFWNEPSLQDAAWQAIPLHGAATVPLGKAEDPGKRSYNLE
ncbi:MAG: hypothetical protein AAFR19_07420 [Pseudomonadota bacterium]